MKSCIKKEGMWRSFLSTCDRCGKTIQTQETLQTKEPDIKEKDYCYYCLLDLLKEKNDAKNNSY